MLPFTNMLKTFDYPVRRVDLDRLQDYAAEYQNALGRLIRHKQSS